MKKSKETKIAKHPPRFLVYGAKMCPFFDFASFSGRHFTWPQFPKKDIMLGFFFEASTRLSDIFAPYIKNLGGCFAIFVSLDFFTVCLKTIA